MKSRGGSSEEVRTVTGRRKITEMQICDQKAEGKNEDR